MTHASGRPARARAEGDHGSRAPPLGAPRPSFRLAPPLPSRVFFLRLRSSSLVCFMQIIFCSVCVEQLSVAELPRRRARVLQKARGRAPGAAHEPRVDARGARRDAAGEHRQRGSPADRGEAIGSIAFVRERIRRRCPPACSATQ